MQNQFFLKEIEKFEDALELELTLFPLSLIGSMSCSAAMMNTSTNKVKEF